MAEFLPQGEVRWADWSHELMRHYWLNHGIRGSCACPVLRLGTMPYVNVRITKDGVTPQQKAAIVREITDTLVRVLGKRPEHTHVIIDEIEEENWGYAGMLTTEYRKRQQE
jgi:4-oxalocrotonate tautomerase